MKPVYKKLVIFGAPALLLVLALAGAWHWWRSRPAPSVPVATAVEDEDARGTVVRGMPRHNTGVWPPGPPEETGIGYSHLFPIDPRTNYNMAPRDNRYAPTR